MLGKAGSRAHKCLQLERSNRIASDLKSRLQKRDHCDLPAQIGWEISFCRLLLVVELERLILECRALVAINPASVDQKVVFPDQEPRAHIVTNGALQLRMGPTVTGMTSLTSTVKR